MCDLENRPQNLISLLAFVGIVLRILHLVGELEEGIFDIVEPFRRRFSVARGTHRRHYGDVRSRDVCLLKAFCYQGSADKLCGCTYTTRGCFKTVEEAQIYGEDLCGL